MLPFATQKGFRLRIQQSGACMTLIMFALHLRKGDRSLGNTVNSGVLRRNDDALLVEAVRFAKGNCQLLHQKKVKVGNPSENK